MPKGVNGEDTINNSCIQLLCLIGFQNCIDWVTKMKSGSSQGCEAKRINCLVSPR